MKKEVILNKRNFLISIILGIFLFSINLIIATNSMSSPVNYQNSSSPLTITVLYDGKNVNNMTNVTCYFNSSGGSALELPLSILNTSSTQTIFTGNKALTIETRSYNVTCLLQNCSEVDCTTNSTFHAINITIDNTAPTLVTTTDNGGVTQSKVFQKESIGLNWSCTDSLSGVTSTSVSYTANGDAGCTIAGTTSWATSTGSQSLSGTQTQCAGKYTIASTCTDYSGNTATDSDIFNIYYPEGGSAFIPDTNQVINPVTKQVTSRTKIIFIIFGIISFIILVAILSLFLISQSKRR